MNTRKRATDLEKSLADLEAIVERLESGELTMDKALKEFERGVRLSRECQTALKEAEQRVQILLGPDLEDFAIEDDEETAGEED
ncbi:MAG: exodeoxyribonuclease VII small subunit [Chromatiales bacterium]|nr:exodeoxyribonuclease VII small subunit [Chromatiales bacterium]